MNWYLVILVVLFATSHSYSVFKTARDKTVSEAVVTAVVLSAFWWLFYMAGIFTLL
jgi:uncharacterized protein with PQ loop repeat